MLLLNKQQVKNTFSIPVFQLAHVNLFIFEETDIIYLLIACVLTPISR